MGQDGEDFWADYWQVVLEADEGIPGRGCGEFHPKWCPYCLYSLKVPIKEIHPDASWEDKCKKCESRGKKTPTNYRINTED